MENFDTGSIVFPHKLKKKVSIYLVFGCLDLVLFFTALALFVSLVSPLLRGGSFSAWLGAPLLTIAIWGIFGFFVALGFWPSLTLYPDYLLYRFFWVRYKVPYQDIREVIADVYISTQGGSSLTLWLHHAGTGKSPFKINLTTFTAPECILLMNTIQKLAQHASLNELSTQIKAGNVPRI